MSLGYLEMVFYVSARVKYVENYAEDPISSFCPRLTFSVSTDTNITSILQTGIYYVSDMEDVCTCYHLMRVS